MAQHVLNPAYHRVEVDEFLAMDFIGARAELEDGVIQVMAGEDVSLPSTGLILPHADIFAAD